MDKHPAPESGNECYRVADLVIDAGTRCVSRGADKIPLPGLSFNLLLELIRAAPNLVSIDELMQRVWPGLVVNPETISQRIKLLRKALGDDAHAPQYVLGVRGHGCRLAVMPERLPAAAPARSGSHEPAAAITIAKEGKRGWWQRLRVPVMVALVVAAVGLLAYRLANQGVQSTDPGQDPSWQPSHAQSIAVLPFLSLSGGERDALIGLGIAENVLHQLAQLPELHVIARTSSFALGAGNVDARRIGRTLNAHFLLEGSVQKEGDNLRVLAQLIDATSGEHLWSLRFDETMPDLFAVQDRIASAVAEALTVNVDRVSGAQAAPRGTASLDAWLYYQQGSRLLLSRRHEDIERGRLRFEAALREDPDFAAARVGLAEAVLLRAFHDASEFWFLSRVPMSEADRALAESEIEKAIALDPGDGDAYVVRAWLSPDRSTAEAEYRRGLALNPNSAAGHERLARLLFFMPDKEERSWDAGKRAEAFVLIDRALQLDPLSPSVHLTQALMLLYGRSDVPGAEAATLRSLEQDPNYFPALERLGELRWCCQGQYAEAVKYLEAALAVEPDAVSPRHFLVRTYLDLADIDAAQRVADTLPDGDTLARVPIALARGDLAGAAALLRAETSEIVTGLDDTMWVNTRFLEDLDSPQPATVEQRWSDWVGVDWTDPDNVLQFDGHNDKRAAVDLGALLTLGEQPERGRRLLEGVLKVIHREADDLERGYPWYFGTLPAALAWLGRYDEALDELERDQAAGFLHDWWYIFDIEPAFSELRANPRFLALRASAEANSVQQRKLLAAMQQRGEVPLR